jgi:uncharacterized DUF497 family protein
MGFEWDPGKSASNEAKHGIPLDVVQLCFELPLLARRSDRTGEERWLALGSLEGAVIAFVYTKRGDTIRLISARRANRNERKRYFEIAGAHGR